MSFPITSARCCHIGRLMATNWKSLSTPTASPISIRAATLEEFGRAYLAGVPLSPVPPRYWRDRRHPAARAWPSVQNQRPPRDDSMIVRHRDVSALPRCVMSRADLTRGATSIKTDFPDANYRTFK